MDPNAALKDIRRWAKESRMPTISPEARDELHALVTSAVEALDEWLSKGGFLPDAWQHKPENDPYYTITSGDVGRAFITAFGEKWNVADFLGRILPRDVGKRVYRATGHVLQPESDEQFAKRKR